MNRFYDSPGDISLSLSPLELKKRGFTNKWRAIFELQEPIKFRSDIAGGDIVVPARFLSDLASIPKVAWFFFMAPDDPRIALGAYVHDWLYGNIGVIPNPYLKRYLPTPMCTPPSTMKTLTRKECDKILAYEAMNDLGATKLQQNAVYWLLHLFGGRSFNQNPPQVRWKFSHIHK